LTKFVHISLPHEVEALKDFQTELVEKNISILNFDLKKNLRRSLALHKGITQVHFASHTERTPLQGDDLDFIANGADFVGVWERNEGMHRRANFYRFLDEVVDLAERCKNFIEKNKITQVWYNMVPHSFEEYVFAHILSSSGGKVYYLSPSFFPWSVTLWCGLSEKQRITTIPESLTIANTLKYQQLKRQKISPGLILQKKQNQKFKWYKLVFTKPLDLLKRFPLLTWRLAIKRNTTSILRKGSIVIYLHYQPEASTIPFFGNLIAQTSIISRLKYYSNTKVYLKEHPNQLNETPPVKSRARWTSLYYSIYERYEIKFVNSNLSLDDALKNDVKIFSISGSVVFEYLQRGGIVLIPKESPILSEEIKSHFISKSSSKDIIKLKPSDLPKIVNFESCNSVTLNDQKMKYDANDRFKILIKLVNHVHT